MLLTLDISNTTIKAGVFNKDKLLADWRFATERHKLADEYGMLLLSLFQANGVPASEITGESLVVIESATARRVSVVAAGYVQFVAWLP